MRKRTTLFVVLLVLVVLTPIVAMVWFGVLIDRQRARDASAAFAQVEMLGGVVWSQAVPFEKYGHYVVEFSPNAKLTDDNISQLASLNTLPAKNTLDVVIHTTNVTDQAIPQLKAIETIDGLDVTKSAISDRGIDELRQALPETIVKERGTVNAAE